MTNRYGYVDLTRYDWSAGYCLAFARALRAAIGKGAELVDVVEPADPENARKWGWSGNPHHVVVKYADHYYDSEGEYTADDVIAKWMKRASDNHYPIRQPFRLEPHSVDRARVLKAPRNAVIAAARQAREIAQIALKRK